MRRRALGSTVFGMNIDVYSDLICPWCFIGKRRLDEVLASPAGNDVDVVWRPFQLYPGLPRAGVDRAEFFKARYGPEADPGKTPSRIRAEAQSVGIDFNFAAVERVPNTLAGHRLLEKCAGDRQHVLAEALFQAYFCDGRDVGDLDVLAGVAASVGFDREDTRAFLASEEGEKEVLEQIAAAREEGMAGVPCFVLAGRFSIPGAQPLDTMTKLIERAKERLA